MNFFVFFVWTRTTFLPNGVRKFRDLQGQNQGHRIRTEIQRFVQAKRSEIRTWFAWTGIGKVYAVNRTHQPDFIYDDLEVDLQGHQKLKIE